MPDIRGRKMSMGTTSGWARGIIRNASSAVAQAQSQAKSGKKLISLVQLSRTFGWSSTKATLICLPKDCSAERLPFINSAPLALGGIMVQYDPADFSNPH